MRSSNKNPFTPHLPRQHPYSSPTTKHAVVICCVFSGFQTSPSSSSTNALLSSTILFTSLLSPFSYWTLPLHCTLIGSSLQTLFLPSCAEAISTKSQMLGRAFGVYCRPQNGSILGVVSIIFSVSEFAMYVFIRSINPVLPWSTNST